MIDRTDFFAKNFMCVSTRSVNIVRVSRVNSNDVYCEAMYNDEVYFLDNQEVGYCAKYPRLGGNQGWTRDEGS